MRAPCFHCGKRRVVRRWAPFCSQRCAAERGIESVMDQHYCLTCAYWYEGTCDDHPPKDSLHAGIEEERPRRRANVDLKLSPTQIAILRRAARRPTGHVCPTRLRGAVEEACLGALEKRGMITCTDPTDGSLAPTITEAGRDAVRLPGEDL